MYGTILSKPFFQNSEGPLNRFPVNVRVEDLDLFEEARSLIAERGVEELYPPQAGAVEAGLLEGRNLTLAVPTASGKTMVAELAMLRALLNGGKALYIVPLRALASEKYDTFSEYQELGLRVGIATGDFDESGEYLGRYDLVVATSEKVDSLMRNGASWLGELDVVVLDEVHLVNDKERGPTLEVVVAHLRDQNPDAQMLALSATVSNADDVAQWLDADLVSSDWRPVDLRKGVLYGSALSFEDGSKEKVELNHSDLPTALALDAVEKGGQCIVFASSRRQAETAAKRVANALGESLDGLAEEVAEVDSTDTSKDLSRYVRGGAAFHHAGLTWKHRELVERAFRDRELKVVAATPTLAMGVNMPARRVVIKNYKRYTGAGMEPIPTMEVHQMFGRAGRPGLDDEGEALLIAKRHEELEELMERYVEAESEEVFSKLASLPALRKHLLALVAGRPRSREEVMEFLEGTLYAVQSDREYLRETVDEALEFLINEGFLVEADGLAVTRVGKRVAQLYIDPMSGSVLLNGMERAGYEKYSDVGLLHLVAATPDLRSMYLRKADEETMNRYMSAHLNDLLFEPAQRTTGFVTAKEVARTGPYTPDIEDFLCDLKVARLLQWWVDEKPENEITEEFGVGPGDIRYRVETAEWLLHATTELARLEGMEDVRRNLDRLHTRIRHGVQEELLELVDLTGVGRVRARALYNRGYRTAAEVLETATEELAEVEGLGTRTALKIKGEEVPDRDEEDVSGSDTGDTEEEEEEPEGSRENASLADFV